MNKQEEEKKRNYIYCNWERTLDNSNEQNKKAK